MGKLPAPPREIPASRDLSKLAPRFRVKVEDVLSDMRALGHDAIVAEAFRSDARQEYLYGFGRAYDDGRGIVTHADSGAYSWHFYCLAVDIVSESKQWAAPAQFWIDLASCAVARGLTAGALWATPDRPHIQWGPPMRDRPARAWEIFQKGGLEAVWAAVGAA